MNADPLTYAPFLLLLLLGALVEIRYWIRNRARMTPKARLRRGLFLAAVPVLCAALWLGWERAAMPGRMAETAAVLFTSGSETAPKGVPLSHANILANCRDIAAVLSVTGQDRMLGMLPPFHSLGLTGNIALPLCFGLPVVFHPNPTEAARLNRICRRWRPTLTVAPVSYTHLTLPTICSV